MFEPLRKYADFNGRARRAEYWLFFLFNVVAALAAMIIDSTAAMIWLVWLALLIPNIAVGVRRLHDINMSGWWYLINLVPLLGALVFFVFTLMPGNPHPNRFGEVPSDAPTA